MCGLPTWYILKSCLHVGLYLFSIWYYDTLILLTFPSRLALSYLFMCHFLFSYLSRMWVLFLHCSHKFSLPRAVCVCVWNGNVYMRKLFRPTVEYYQFHLDPYPLLMWKKVLYVVIRGIWVECCFPKQANKQTNTFKSINMLILGWQKITFLRAWKISEARSWELKPSGVVYVLSTYLLVFSCTGFFIPLARALFPPAVGMHKKQACC